MITGDKKYPRPGVGLLHNPCPKKKESKKPSKKGKAATKKEKKLNHHLVKKFWQATYEPIERENELFEEVIEYQDDE